MASRISSRPGALGPQYNKLYFFGNWAPAKARLVDPDKKISTYYSPAEIDRLINAAAAMHLRSEYLSSAVDHKHRPKNPPGHVLAMYRTRDNDIGCIGRVTDEEDARDLWNRVERNRAMGNPDIGLSPFLASNFIKEGDVVTGVDSREVYHVSLVDDPDHGDFGTWVQYTAPTLTELMTRFNDYRRANVAYIADSDMQGLKLFEKRSRLVEGSQPDRVMYYGEHNKGAHEAEVAIDSSTPLCQALLEEAPAKPSIYLNERGVAPLQLDDKVAAGASKLVVDMSTADSEKTETAQETNKTASGESQIITHQQTGSTEPTISSPTALISTETVPEVESNTEVNPTGSSPIEPAPIQDVEMSTNSTATVPPMAQQQQQQQQGTPQPAPVASAAETAAADAEARRLAAMQEGLNTIVAAHTLPSDIDADEGGRQASTFKRTADGEIAPAAQKIAAAAATAPTNPPAQQQQQQQQQQQPAPTPPKSDLYTIPAADYAEVMRMKEEYVKLQEETRRKAEADAKFQEEFKALKEESEKRKLAELNAKIELKKNLLKDLHSFGVEDGVLSNLEQLMGRNDEAGDIAMKTAEQLKISAAAGRRGSDYVPPWRSTESIVDSMTANTRAAVQNPAADMPPLVSFKMPTAPSSYSTTTPSYSQASAAYYNNYAPAPRNTTMQNPTSAPVASPPAAAATAAASSGEASNAPQLVQLSAAASKSGLQDVMGAISNWRAELPASTGAPSNPVDAVQLHLNTVLHDFKKHASSMNYDYISKRREDFRKTWTPDDYADIATIGQHRSVSSDYTRDRIEGYFAPELRTSPWGY